MGKSSPGGGHSRSKGCRLETNLGYSKNPRTKRRPVQLATGEEGVIDPRHRRGPGEEGHCQEVHEHDLGDPGTWMETHIIFLVINSN